MRVCPQCARQYSEGEAFCPFDGVRLREGARAMATVPPVDPHLGRLLDGRYRVDRVLGRGGMGTVYAGVLEALQKPVALKLLRPVQDDDGQAVGRFEREARAASRLGSPHIVDIFDFGRTAEGLPFLVMELLDGEDLGNVLARERQLPLERALRIVLQCCEGLGAAHAAGIVHRDLKPENVFLVRRGAEPEYVKIVDFGLAKISETEVDGAPGRKLTKTGMIFGTPQYMSPEQCLGRPTDHRSDVYALGLILYELLAGRVPFDGDTFMSVIQQHLSDPPPALREINAAVQIPPAVEAVIYRALDKRAGERPQSMGDLAQELLSALRVAGLHAMADRLAVHGGAIEEPAAAMALTKKKAPSIAPAPMPAPAGESVRPAGESVRPPPASLAPGVLPRAVPRDVDAWAATAAGVPAIDPVAAQRTRSATPTDAIPREPRTGLSTPPPPASPGRAGWLLLGVALIALGGLLGYLALVLAG
ncbi:MAG: protein kinase [Myxococcales bacterium]|nr:protein kinase [Myxococcales bacterium]